jgi:hypothetical protein
VKNGVVVFDEGTPLPDGTPVQVSPMPKPEPTVKERWERLSGMAKGLPPDLAKNHDHYLHGQPKK